MICILHFQRYSFEWSGNHLLASVGFDSSYVRTAWNVVHRIPRQSLGRILTMSSRPSEERCRHSLFRSKWYCIYQYLEYLTKRAAIATEYLLRLWTPFWIFQIYEWILSAWQGRFQYHSPRNRNGRNHCIYPNSYQNRIDSRSFGYKQTRSWWIRIWNQFLYSRFSSYWQILYSGQQMLLIQNHAC